MRFKFLSSLHIECLACGHDPHEKARRPVAGPVEFAWHTSGSQVVRQQDLTPTAAKSQPRLDESRFLTTVELNFEDVPYNL